VKTITEGPGDYKKLYRAANEMAADITMTGELTVNSGSFERLWELLHDIDGGTYEPDAEFQLSEEWKAEIVFQARQIKMNLC